MRSGHPTLEKQPRAIQSMFDAVAAGYDRANTVLSLGIHKLWKRRFVDAAELQSGHVVLDCATGTGDIALIMARRFEGSVRVIGADFCPAMVQQAPGKFQGFDDRASFLAGDAMQLPFASSMFDRVTIAFGIRNIFDPSRAVSEFARVLKPTGRLCVLEFGTPRLPGWRELFGFYSRHILPYVGGMLTGQPAAYRYLQESSAAFPTGVDFVRLVESHGQFRELRTLALTGGVAWMYVFERKE